jgi:ribosomal protein S18 acetylase RimI-like enzyme
MRREIFRMPERDAVALLARARVLHLATTAALMAKYQPEGRHVPIAADHPLYRRALDGVLVLRVALTRVDGKAKLAQNRGAEERARLLEGLWRRGEPGDVEALEAIRAACPDTPLPAVLAPHGAATLHAALRPEAVEEAALLLAGAYWWKGTPRELVAVVHRASQAWVGARDVAERLVATARAVSDGKTVWIYDVAVDAAWRGRGLGQRVVALLLDHPAVRAARTVRLATKDAQGLYARFGFRDHAAVERPFPSTEMTLIRC